MKRILAFAAALLCASPSFAAKLYISEYTSIGTSNAGSIPVAAEPPILDQTPIDFSAGVQSSQQFNANTQYIRLYCDVICSIKTRSGCTGATATIANKPMGAGGTEYFGVRPGDCISVIANP